MRVKTTICNKLNGAHYFCVIVTKPAINLAASLLIRQQRLGSGSSTVLSCGEKTEDGATENGTCTLFDRFETVHFVGACPLMFLPLDVPCDLVDASSGRLNCRVNDRAKDRNLCSVGPKKHPFFESNYNKHFAK